MATPTKAKPKAKAPRPVPTFDHLVSSKKPLRQTVPVYTDDETLEVYERAVETLESARTRAKQPGQPELDEAPLLTAVESAKKALDETTITCVFESIGRKNYDALIREFPATPEEDEEHQKQHGTPAPYSADGFSVALISASCIEPRMAREDVEVLKDTWNTAEYVQLWVAALAVNTQRRVAAEGKGFG